MRELRSIAVALFFLVLGLMVLWSAERLTKDGPDETAALALLLIPVILYLALSGRLKRITGGSLDVEFSELTSPSVGGLRVAPSATSIHPEKLEKGGVEKLDAKLRRIHPDKIVVLTLTVEPGGAYERHVLSDYLDALGQFPTFKCVVFLEPDGKFIGFMPAAEAVKAISSAEADGFVAAVNEGNSRALLDHRAVTNVHVPANASDADALQEMSRHNTRALAVVDKDEKLVGFAERDQVISRMLLALTR